MSPSSLSCSVVADVVRAERERQSSSGRLVVAHVVEASKGRVQDGLLHDDGDEAVRSFVRLLARSLVPSFACLLVRLFARSRVC